VLLRHVALIYVCACVFVCVCVCIKMLYKIINKVAHMKQQLDSWTVSIPMAMENAYPKLAFCYPLSLSV